MENTQIIRAALKAEGITECGFLPRTHFRVLNERLMQRCDGLQSAVVFLIPYRCDASPKDGLNISLYARVKDYHAYFAALSERLLAALRSIFPDERFAGFCDHSPIDEKDAARTVRAGRSRPQFAADQRHLRQLRLYRLAADESGFKREPQLHRRAVLRLRPLRTRLPRIRNDGQRHRRGQMPIRDYAEKAQNARGRSPAAANRRRLGLRRLPARLPDEPAAPRTPKFRFSKTALQICCPPKQSRRCATRNLRFTPFHGAGAPSSPTTSGGCKGNINGLKIFILSIDRRSKLC